jgi:DNA primase
MQFTDILREHGIQFLEAGGGGHTREGWINFACPFCGGGKHKDSMGYNLAKGFVSCYRCGSHRTNETLVELLKLSYAQVKKLLGGVDTVRSKEIVSKRGKLVLPKGVEPLLPAHRRYLRGRGFDPDELERLWHLKGIGQAARLGWRIFIPWESRGEVVSWTTRAISDNASIRYLSASEEEEIINHKELLYGEDLVRGHACGIVEGQPDAWAGGPGFVATGGTSLTRAQILRMTRFLRRGRRSPASCAGIAG